MPPGVCSCHSGGEEDRVPEPTKQLLPPGRGIPLPWTQSGGDESIPAIGDTVSSAERRSKYKVFKIGPLKNRNFASVVPELEPGRYGLQPEDPVDPTDILDASCSTVRQAVDALKAAYCGPVASDLSYLEVRFRVPITASGKYQPPHALQFPPLVRRRRSVSGCRPGWSGWRPRP